MGYVKYLILYCLLPSCLFIQCFNPFFPETAPYTKPFLDSPGAVVEELWRAYSTQDLGLFDSLFYNKNEFKFFIDKKATVEYELTKITNNIERPDSLRRLLPPGNYLYLTYSDEKKIHNQLFSPSVIMKTINELYYRVEYIIPDTVSDPSIYDPVEAIVITEPANVLIESERIANDDYFNGASSWNFQISEQRFLVKKNDDNQWKMCFWYEPN